MNTADNPAPATGHAVTEQAFRVGDWHVDPASDCIQRGSQIVRLEPKVMEVLVILARRPGRVVSREELESSLSGGSLVTYDALSSTVLKLRKAFNDNPKHPRFVETVPKRGYRLVATVEAVDVGSGQATHDPGTGRSSILHRPGASTVAGIAIVVLLVSVIGYYLYQGNSRSAQVPPGVASLAVLPFDNLGDDPEQDYFVNGITHDLITDLTRLSSLLVISRDSSFVYKGVNMDMYQIARTLNVRYVLHGSVRRNLNKIRINAILTDTRRGNHIWAERYNGDAGNLFEFQEQITQRIIAALALKLTPAERQNLFQPGTSNTMAYDYFMRGTEQFFRYSRSGNREARGFFQKAIELDAGFARAYAMLAWTHAFDFMNGWSERPAESLALGERLATKALGLEKNLPVAYFVRGLVYREMADHTKALADAEQAVSLDPSYANGHVLHATLLYYAGRPEEGLEKIKMAIRLNPHHPFNYPFHLGQAYFVLERYPEAIDAFKNGLASNPSSERLRVWLAATYAQSGDIEEARWQVEQIKLVNPELSLAGQRQAFPFRDSADLDRFVAGLRKAGLTE